MAVQSFYPEHGKWLDSFGKDAKEGDTPCISVGHPIFGGEFTTYRLPAPVGVNKWGEPLFDMADPEILISDSYLPEGREGVWATRSEITAAKDARHFDGDLIVSGINFGRPSGFGNFRRAKRETV